MGKLIDDPERKHDSRPIPKSPMCEHDPIRPMFAKSMSQSEFERWYWPKAELQKICRSIGLNTSGSKAYLRASIASYLGDGHEAGVPSKQRHIRGDDWSRKSLALDTIINQSITFGPHVRGFFREHIGTQFRCTADFMEWVKQHNGATLGDAVTAWHALTAEKAVAGYRKEIALHNNYLRYLREFKSRFPELTLEDAKCCWHAKKLRPAVAGQVVVEATDTRFLG